VLAQLLHYWSMLYAQLDSSGDGRVHAAIQRGWRPSMNLWPAARRQHAQSVRDAMQRAAHHSPPDARTFIAAAWTQTEARFPPMNGCFLCSAAAETPL
jgi:hypothetical protein